MEAIDLAVLLKSTDSHMAGAIIGVGVSGEWGLNKSEFLIHFFSMSITKFFSLLIEPLLKIGQSYSNILAEFQVG